VARSAEAGETLRDDLSVRDACQCALVEQRADGGGERSPERVGFDRADVRVLEPNK